MKDYSDIKKSETKLIKGEKWRFDFRENGYVILSKFKNEIINKKEVASWGMQLHGIDLTSCLQYIFTYYRLEKPLEYKDLKDSDV